MKKLSNNLLFKKVKQALVVKLYDKKTNTWLKVIAKISLKCEVSSEKVLASFAYRGFDILLSNAVTQTFKCGLCAWNVGACRMTFYICSLYKGAFECAELAERLNSLCCKELSNFIIYKETIKSYKDYITTIITAWVMLYLKSEVSLRKGVASFVYRWLYFFFQIWFSDIHKCGLCTSIFGATVDWNCAI